MDERAEAIRLANKVLETPNRDPDDDLSMMSRQFLRAVERLPPQPISDYQAAYAVLWRIITNDDVINAARQRLLALVGNGQRDALEWGIRTFGPPGARLETTSEHIARDMRSGIFPERSDPEAIKA